MRELRNLSHEANAIWKHTDMTVMQQIAKYVRELFLRERNITATDFNMNTGKLIEVVRFNLRASVFLHWIHSHSKKLMAD